MTSCTLPVEVWQSVTPFLPAKDVLSLLSMNRACSSLRLSVTFWKQLLDRDNDSDSEWLQNQGYDVVRRAFLSHAYKNSLRSVRWYPLRSDRIRISDREGHLACVMKNSTREQRRIVVTGGFSDDESVCKYCKLTG
jgi:hypothetical protein